MTVQDNMKCTLEEIHQVPVFWEISFVPLQRNAYLC